MRPALADISSDTEFTKHIFVTSVCVWVGGYVYDLVHTNWFYYFSGL